MREMLKVISFWGFFLEKLKLFKLKKFFFCSDKLALLPEISKGKNTIL